jgi:hypothetical protein
MATIKPRRGTSVPTAGTIIQNELAVDTTNKRIYIGAADGSGTLIGAAPAGSDTQVQFNDGGNLGGDSGLTYNKTTDTLTVTGDVAVNGGDLTTSSATASLFNATATTINFGGAATSLIIGATSGTTQVRNDLQLNAQSDLRFADSDSSNYVALQAPATVASNVTWTLPSTDGTNGQALVTNGTGTLSWATAAGGGFTWTATTADATMAVDNGYLANKSSGTLTLTLPTTAAVGKTIRVSGMQNVWRIAQNASQKIHFGKTTTTTGTGGYLESTNARDAVELVCCVADNEWNVVSSIGNITIV